jgi:hypothetical protein
MLRRLFRDKVHPKVVEKLIGPSKDPYCEINCRHIVIPAEQFDGEYLGKGKRNVRFVSIYLDVDNKHIMEAVGQTYFMYVVPRWQTVSGSQYAYSPATIAALPDARLIQAMTLTLLEAGEKATNPPMVAVQEAIRSDVAVYAGGVTWVDAEYDERLGRFFGRSRRTSPECRSGWTCGATSHRPFPRRSTSTSCLRCRPMGAQEITAYEAAQRVQDYIRQAAPMFEPLEHEDNGAICETTFELMMSAGAFGSLDDVPQSLRGKDITFRFESPLHDAIERRRGRSTWKPEPCLRRRFRSIRQRGRTSISRPRFGTRSCPLACLPSGSRASPTRPKRSRRRRNSKRPPSFSRPCRPGDRSPSRSARPDRRLAVSRFPLAVAWRLRRCDRCSDDPDAPHASVSALAAPPQLTTFLRWAIFSPAP